MICAGRSCGSVTAPREMRLSECSTVILIGRTSMLFVAICGIEKGDAMLIGVKGDSISMIAKDSKKYLVVGGADGDMFAEMWSPGRILDYMDMSDCYEYDVFRVYDIGSDGSLSEVTLHGAWHDPSRPLYMKGVDKGGNVLFYGYGTDH